MAGPIARRREIRRAFGKHALDVLNAQGEALGGLIPIVGEQKAKLEAQGQFIADLSVRLDVYERRFQKYREESAERSFRAFWGRLKWFVLGNRPSLD